MSRPRPASSLPRLIWGWSESGKRTLIAIPAGVPIDPPLDPGEIEIDVCDEVGNARVSPRPRR